MGRGIGAVVNEESENIARPALAKLVCTLYSTNLADYQACKGLHFRDNHDVVSQAVVLGIELSRNLAELSLEGSAAAGNNIGGTAPQQVCAAIVRARSRFDRGG